MNTMTTHNTAASFWPTLRTAASLYIGTYTGSKYETALKEDMLAMCDWAITETAAAPSSSRQLHEILLNGAMQKDSEYPHRDWVHYVRGCGALALSPDADAIRAHYFTAEKAAALGLSWSKAPGHFADWQAYEAHRLHAAANQLAAIATALGLYPAK